MKKNKVKSHLLIVLVIIYTLQSNLSFSQESPNYSLIPTDSIQLEFEGFANQLLIENTIFKIGVVSLKYPIDESNEDEYNYQMHDLYLIGDSSIKHDEYLKFRDLISWKKKFYEFIPEHPALSKKEYDLFSFQYLDTISNVTYEIDGVVYDKIMFINKRKYCLYKNKFSEFDQERHISQLDSILKKLSEIYPIKIKEYHLFGLNGYELSFKNYLKEHYYSITLEFTPRDFVKSKKTTKNSLMDNNEYSPLKYCNCDNYDLTILFASGSYYTGGKGFKQYSEKYGEPMDISFQIDYLLIRLEDLKIIQHGIESAMKMEYSKDAMH